VRERLQSALERLGSGDGFTAVEIAPSVFGEELTQYNAGWRLQETMCYLQHLEVQGRVVRESDGGAERWRLA
jgi:hypothetical protein